MKKCKIFHDWSALFTMADGTGRWMKQCNKCLHVKIVNER